MKMTENGSKTTATDKPLEFYNIAKNSTEYVNIPWAAKQQVVFKSSGIGGNLIITETVGAGGVKFKSYARAI